MICTHLSSDVSGRTLDPTLIRSMSPLTIQPAGYTILENSGFKTIMDNQVHRQVILKFIADASPNTRLDVEQKALILFSTLMLNEYMNPIKTYLYDNPAAREIFPTLAGLYIRDEYLKDHPEITQ